MGRAVNTLDAFLTDMYGEGSGTHCDTGTHCDHNGHPFIGNAGDREQWGIFQGKSLCRRAQMKRLKHAWGEKNHVVVPFVSETLGSLSGESACCAVPVRLVPGSA